jgi:hypothetical protein
MLTYWFGLSLNVLAIFMACSFRNKWASYFCIWINVPGVFGSLFNILYVLLLK